MPMKQGLDRRQKPWRALLLGLGAVVHAGKKPPVRWLSACPTRVHDKAVRMARRSVCCMYGAGRAGKDGLFLSGQHLLLAVTYCKLQSVTQHCCA